MTQSGTLNLSSTFVRLRSDASVEPLPVGEGFWEDLSSGRLGTFHHEYLVTLHSMGSDWTSWEIHPNGDEIVCLISGAITLILEQQDGNREVDLDRPGAYAIVPTDTWHTARVRKESSVLFITAGEGTRHRPAKE